MHRSHHRLGALHDGVKHLPCQAVEFVVFARLARELGALLDVGASTKMLARASQHHRPHVIAVGQRVENTNELLAHGPAGCVDRGSVQGHHGHVVLNFHLNIAHRLSPFEFE